MVTATIFIALLPALICTIVLAAVRAWRSAAQPQLAWAVPLSVAAGFVAAQVAVDGTPRLPPIEASGWFSIVVVVLGLFAIAVRPRLTPRLWHGLSVLLAFAVVVAIVHPLIGEAWPIGVALLWIAGMTVVTALAAWLVDRRPAAGAGAPLSLLIAASGVAAILAVCGSARYGQLGGAIASAMGPLTALGLIRREARLVEGGAWLSVMILAMLLIAGVAYVDVPVFIAFVGIASPLGVLVGELPFAARLTWWKRDLLCGAVTVAIVALALCLAAATASHAASY